MRTPTELCSGKLYLMVIETKFGGALFIGGMTERNRLPDPSWHRVDRPWDSGSLPINPSHGVPPRISRGICSASLKIFPSVLACVQTIYIHSDFFFFHF